MGNVRQYSCNLIHSTRLNIDRLRGGDVDTHEQAAKDQPVHDHSSFCQIMHSHASHSEREPSSELQLPRCVVGGQKRLNSRGRVRIGVALHIECIEGVDIDPHIHGFGDRKDLEQGKICGPVIRPMQVCVGVRIDPRRSRRVGDDRAASVCQMNVDIVGQEVHIARASRTIFAGNRSRIQIDWGLIRNRSRRDSREMRLSPQGLFVSNGETNPLNH